jgi:hypothetical protein
MNSVTQKIIEERKSNMNVICPLSSSSSLPLPSLPLPSPSKIGWIIVGFFSLSTVYYFYTHKTIKQ